MFNISSLAPFLEKSKKMEKPSKIQILVHEALLCELVGGNNHKLAIPQGLKKKHSQNDLSRLKLLGFQGICPLATSMLYYMITS